MVGALLTHGTLPLLYRDLMDAPTIRSERCVVCGAPATNQHHIVWRSWGELWDTEGNNVPKPTVSLCGMGNVSGCHGLAHARMLHFRYAGRLEYLITEQPMKYQYALDMEGWKEVRA